MVKKAKAKKAKAKKVSARRAPSRSAKGGLQVPMHSIVHFVRMLHDEKHAAKFLNAAKASKAKTMVTLHPSTVNFVKKYVGDNQLQAPMAAKVVDPCPGDPFECHFQD
jgi:hypothetical protein